MHFRASKNRSVTRVAFGSVSCGNSPAGFPDAATTAAWFCSSDEYDLFLGNCEARRQTPQSVRSTRCPLSKAGRVRPRCRVPSRFPGHGGGRDPGPAPYSCDEFSLHFSPVLLRQRQPAFLELEKPLRECGNPAIVIRILCRLYVAEKLSNPGLQVPLEEPVLPGKIQTRGRIDQQGHGFAKGGKVVFGFRDIIRPLDAECVQIRAQTRKRLVQQEPGQVPARIGQYFSTTEADEQGMKFAIQQICIRVAAR